jgi:hypothetical protein
MLNPLNKVRKAVSSDLRPGEEVVAATLVHPAGTMGRNIARGVGGLAGSLAASKAGSKRTEALGGANQAGIAASLPPGKELWLGLTPQRMLVWSHSSFKGKPKELVATFGLDQIAGIEIDTKKTVHAMVMRFSDHSALDFDVPKVGGDAPGFQETLSGLKA